MSSQQIEVSQDYLAKNIVLAGFHLVRLSIAFVFRILIPYEANICETLTSKRVESSERRMVVSVVFSLLFDAVSILRPVAATDRLRR